MGLAEYRAEINNYDVKINDNLTALSGLLSALKENVAGGVAATLSASGTPEVYDTVELDEAWWADNAEALGWKKDGVYYTYTDPTTGEKFYYDPKKGNLKVEFSDGSTRSDISCKLFLSGDLSDVTETITCLKNYSGGYHVGDTATEPRLVIVPGFGSESEGTAINSFLSSHLGDTLLRSAGNNDVKHTLAGFSAGGYEGLYMVSGERDSKRYQISGYYDKLTLINISPRKIDFTDRQVECMSGMEFDIVTNYNNLNESGVSITADYYNKQRGGPYLDKLLAIPGSKVTVFVPDTGKDTHGDVTKFAAYASGKGVEVVNYPVPDELLKRFGSGRGSSHEEGRGSLFGYYLSGNCVPITE